MAEAEHGLAGYDPRWERGTRGGRGDVFADGEVLLASDFEGANGCNFRSLAPHHYAVDLEKEPGTHRFGGLAYYVCVGVRNKLSHRRRVRLRLNANCEGYWGEQSASFQVRHRGEWSEIPTGDIHRVPDLPDSLDLDLTLPPAGPEQDGTIFVSNYHWWPYTEMLDWLQTVDAGTVRQLGGSFQGRAVYAVEFGEPGNPTMVHTQTPQPSEMGSLACRAMIDFLGSGSAAADAIVRRFHVCFIPMTNPDGTVLGYGVSDSQGRFPYFEGDQAALHSPEATPEIRNVWRYLEEKRPWLFWEWHSNHWKRRPGHMLLRYRPECLADAARQELWRDIDARLLALPDTHHGNWTGHQEGLYQNSLGFQAVIRLHAISCMVKQHDKFPLEQSRRHAIACLQVAADAYGQAGEK